MQTEILEKCPVCKEHVIDIYSHKCSKWTDITLKRRMKNGDKKS